MKLKYIIIAALTMGCVKANAQSFAINTTGAAAHNSAILDVTSTSKGVLVPRVSTAQRTAIATPAKGLMVYDSTLNQFAYYNGTAWQLISTAANSWTVSGSNQYSAVSGNVGIGTATPTDKVHVVGNIRVDGGKLPFVNTGQSVFIGDNAGLNDDLNNRNNVFVGNRAGQNNTTGNGNTFVGSSAGLSTTTGTLNTAVGISALDNNTTGTSNVAIGRSALSANTTGFNNVGIGVGALQLKTSGGANLAIGTNTLINLTSGSNNVAVGILAGSNNVTGSGNVFLGFSAGQNEAGSNKLYIDNSSTATPLIYGNFATDSLKVNGTLTVNNAYTFPSTAGTANQVLQTNGAGQAAWVNASTLAVAETDPQVSSTASNYVPRWNGTTLMDGNIYDDGTNVGVGIVPAYTFQVDMGYEATTSITAEQSTLGALFVGTATNSWQSFTPLSTGTINTISLLFYNTGATTTRTISVYAGQGTGGTLLATSTATSVPLIGATGTWIDFPITGTTLLAGTQYTLVIDNGANALFSTGNPYAGGIADGNSSKDYRFRVYANAQKKGFAVSNTAVSINNYALPIADGTANQVLQTNGAGQTNWVNTTSLAITEVDPQVSSTTANYVPKWNGATLVDGQVFDNGTNVGIGTTSPVAKLHIKGLTAIDSGRIAFINTGNSILIGEDAGLNDNRTNNKNVFIGAFAGESISNGNNNIAIGYEALNASSPLVTGNIAIGSGAMTTSGTGSNNVAIGLNAGSDITANANVVVGTGAGRSAGQSNTIIGTGAYGSAGSTGGNNVIIGNSAGALATGSNNIFIGPNAGFNETGNEKLIIDNIFGGSPLIYGDFATGAVGIGTTNISRAMLTVNGSQTQTFASYGYLNRTHPTGTINGNTTANDYSIYATDRIAAPEFNAFSDARIKNIKGITNNETDLKTLMDIEITDYTLRDSIGKGNKAYKKVIAQQVEKVYPQAVSRLTDVVPDIYQQTEIKDGRITLANNLKIGERVKLIFEGSEAIATVKAADATGFTVDAKQTGKVFVYGREVNDFRSVDYEAISMLHVSATQQLVKELQQQKEQVKQQQQQINQLINEIKNLKQSLPVSPGGAL